MRYFLGSLAHLLEIGVFVAASRRRMLDLFIQMVQIRIIVHRHTALIFLTIVVAILQGDFANFSWSDVEQKECFAWSNFIILMAEIKNIQQCLLLFVFMFYNLTL